MEGFKSRLANIIKDFYNTAYILFYCSNPFFVTNGHTLPLVPIHTKWTAL